MTYALVVWKPDEESPQAKECFHELTKLPDAHDERLEDYRVSASSLEHSLGVPLG